jgi:hypothetical protein
VHVVEASASGARRGWTDEGVRESIREMLRGMLSMSMGTMRISGRLCTSFRRERLITSSNHPEFPHQGSLRGDQVVARL